MLDTQTHQLHHGQDGLHDSTFFFIGSFDDNSFCRGPQCLKPIATSFATKPTTVLNKNIATFAPHIPHSILEDCAVLGDDDEYSEDELPPSPRRRHSGAMSISSEDLPFCYDREALNRDAAAHRARHQQQQMQNLKSGGRMGAFAEHEKWDTEVDGPHMALWVPENGADGDSKRRRVNHQSGSVPSASARARKEVQQPRQVSDIDGPMMALWGI